MNQRIALSVAVLAGAVIGGLAVGGLNAQTPRRSAVGAVAGPSDRVTS